MNDPTSLSDDETDDHVDRNEATARAVSVQSALIRLEASDPADAPPIADEITALLAGRLEAQPTEPHLAGSQESQSQPTQSQQVQSTSPQPETVQHQLAGIGEVDTREGPEATSTAGGAQI